MFWVGLNRPRRLPDPKLLPPVPKRPLRGKQVPRPSQGRGAGATTGPAGQGQPSARDAAAPALRFHFPLPAPIWAKGASLSRSMKFKAREPCCFHFGNCFRTDECSCWEPGRDSDVGTDTSQTLVPATSWSSCRPGWGGGGFLRCVHRQVGLRGKRSAGRVRGRRALGHGLRALPCAAAEKGAGAGARLCRKPP